MIKKLLIGLFLVVCAAHASIDLCGECRKEECMPPLACKGSLTNDTCGCCSICQRAEGEVCGGIHSQLGKCRKGLICMTRDPKSAQNTFLPPGSKVGRCEPEACKGVKCGMHQLCAVVNNAPKCVCSMKCSDKHEPVCGLSDGVDYRNPCKISEKECKLQVEIGYLPGYCKGCSKNGSDFKVGDKVFADTSCKECVCRHGNWVCSLNERCLKEVIYNGFDCTGYTNKHLPIECPDGYTCNITKKGTDGFADRGLCKRLIPDTCEVDGNIYNIGQSFVLKDCLQKCTCHGYEVSCVSLCPPENVTCPDGLRKVRTAKKVSRHPECFCRQEVCMDKDYCQMDGKRLMNGEKFVTSDCKQKCTCDAPGIFCTSLCPPASMECPLGHVVKFTKEKVVNGCTCPTPKCVLADFCKDQGKEYKIGEKFVTSDCSALCTCHGPDVTCKSFCPPNAVVCKHDEEIHYVEVKVYNDSDCTCRKAMCVSTATCRSGGRIHKHGDWFIDNECMENCTCNYGNIECKTLCPLSQMKCKEDEVTVYTREILLEAANCSCPVPSCVKPIRTSCYIGGKQVAYGYSVIDVNCTQKCTCHGDSYSCVSLCPPSKAVCSKDKSPIFIKEKSSLAPQCECKVATCLDSGLIKGTCTHDGKTYSHGDNFITNDCAMNCTCIGPDITCKSLCPVSDATCNGTQVKMFTLQEVAKKCSCRVPICLEKLQDFCLIKNKKYRIGEQFISDNCMSCKCLGPDIQCKTLCPPSDIESCPIGTFMEYVTENYSKETACTCQRPVCVSFEKCVANGKVYRAGETFIEPDCSSKCKCIGPDIGCVTLCPLTSAVCPNNTKKLQMPVEISKSPRCSCIRTECIESSQCSVDGNVYRPGESFVANHCTESCVCHDTGYSCVSLCPPSYVQCSDGQKEIQIDVKVPGTNCSCQRPACVDKDYCEMDGRKYKDGETFIDKSCTSRCTCHAPAISCVSLCPPTNVRCGPGQRVTRTRVRVSNESRCTCLMPSCSGNGNVCSLPADSGHCYGYFVRWYYNAEKQKCEKFVYGGCDGNDNRFKGRKGCESICIEGRFPDPLRSKGLKVTYVLEKWKQFKKQVERTVKVNGKIVLNRKPGIFPNRSCLSISVEDVSRMDAPSITMASQKKDLSGINISENPLHYTIHFLPKPGPQRYAIQAVINVGWCPGKSSKEWIRGNDYLTTMTHTVPLANKKDVYSMDMQLEYYGAQPETSRKLDVVPGSVLAIGEMPYGAETDALPTVKFSNETITVHGTIKFDTGIRKFVSPSCLTLKVEDISMQDASSVVLAKVKRDLSGTEVISNSYKYEISMKKPLEKEFYRTFSIDALFNIGWCSNESKSESNIRHGDFITDTNFLVEFDNKSSSYEKNFNVILYGKLPKVPEPPPVPIPELPELPFVNGSDTAKPKPVEYTNETFTIHGTIRFGAKITKFPSPSCMVIVIEDISLADAASLTLKEQRELVSGLKVLNNSMEYKITMKKPKEKEFHRTFAIDALFNVGWCSYQSSSQSRIGHGDFLTDTNFGIHFSKEGNSYRKDFNVIYYCPSEDCPFSKVVLGLDQPANVTDVERNISCYSNQTGRRYPEGAEWETKDCQYCRCHENGTVCKPKYCPKLSCKETVKLPYNCCPVCANKTTSCVDSSGKKRHVGDAWRTKDDDCKRCSCIPSGRVICSTAHCMRPYCKEGEPIKIPGLCCPVCSNVKVCRESDTDEVYVEGRIWQRSNCSLRYCSSEGIVDVPSGDVVTTCPYPAKIIPSCPELCPRRTADKTKERVEKEKIEKKENSTKTCLDNVTKTKHSIGGLWHPEPCKVCVCGDDLEVRCLALRCKPQKNCAQLVRPKGMCCPLCKSADRICVHKDIKYQTGAYIVKDDKCSVCACDNGKWDCSQELCRPKEPVCTYEGKPYALGETRLASDGCNTCFCAKTGVWGCTLKYCVKPTTPDVSTTEAPTVSPVCTYKGKAYALGETRPSFDGCNTCFCAKNGGWGCTLKFCVKPVTTEAPETELPTAVKECIHGDKKYSIGSSRLADDGCNTCVCSSGGWGCTEMGCPTDSNNRQKDEP